MPFVLVGTKETYSHTTNISGRNILLSPHKNQDPELSLTQVSLITFAAVSLLSEAVCSQGEIIFPHSPKPHEVRPFNI